MTDDKLAVSQEEALRFVEHAMRNWDIDGFSHEDLEDLRAALSDFRAQARLAGERAGMERAIAACEAVLGEDCYCLRCKDFTDAILKEAASITPKGDV